MAAARGRTRLEYLLGSSEHDLPRGRLPADAWLDPLASELPPGADRREASGALSLPGTPFFRRGRDVTTPFFLLAGAGSPGRSRHPPYAPDLVLLRTAATKRRFGGQNYCGSAIVQARRVACSQPSGLKTGFMLASCSSVTPPRTCSSMSNKTVPLRPAISTGTICDLKRPSTVARAARCWLTRANASCISRVMPSCAATFSAVIPM